MTNSPIYKNLFAEQVARHEDQGIMNLGQQCHTCQQVDFLPFHCEYCKFTYCGTHRMPEAHQCPVGPQSRYKKKDSAKNSIVSKEGSSVASLFPDREKDKAKLDKSLEDIQEKKDNNTLAKKSSKNVYSRIAKFLSAQREKSRKSENHLFGAIRKKASPSRKAGEMALLRRSARGHPSCKEADRIYLWCVYLDPGVTGADEKTETDILSNIDPEKQKKPLFVSKQWPVGRCLDSITETLAILNHNNTVRDSNERLCLFKENEGNLELLQTGDRAFNAFKNGDLVYLVRGTL